MINDSTREVIYCVMVHVVLMFFASTQGPSATPRATCIPLYVPQVRTKLVRMFYAAFSQEKIIAVYALRAIESVLLSNVVTTVETNPVTLLAQPGVIDQCIGTEQGEIFAATVLACTPVSEDTKISRISIRDAVIQNPGYTILLYCPLTGLVEAKPSILISACKILQSSSIEEDSKKLSACINFLTSLFHNCSDKEWETIRSSPEQSNILVALAELACPTRDKPLVIESSSFLELRTHALTALSVAISNSTDPVATLRLSTYGGSMTLGKQMFDVMLSELLLESYFRWSGLPPAYSSAAKLRTRRLRDSINILVRLAVTFLDSGHQKSPLDDYSVLIPSLLCLVRSLLTKSSAATSEMDSVIVELIQGDLGFIKELGVPELAGTSFELERSIW